MKANKTMTMMPHLRKTKKSPIHNDLPDIPVGSLLVRGRTDRGWSIVEASNVTACFGEYIAAFEQNGLPSSLSLWHARYVFRRYVSKLGLPWEELWDRLMRQKGIIAQQEALRIRRSPPTLLPVSSSIQTIRVVAQCVVIAAVMLLLGWYVLKTFLPPTLTIEWPLPQMLINDVHVTVVGSVSSQSLLWINGEAVLPDTRGAFRKELYLRPGMNTIRATAKKAHSNVTTIERTVYIKPKNMNN